MEDSRKYEALSEILEGEKAARRAISSLELEVARLMERHGLLPGSVISKTLERLWEAHGILRECRESFEVE